MQKQTRGRSLIENLLEKTILNGSPLISANPLITPFEKESIYEAVIKDFTKLKLPSPKILAKTCINYWQDGIGTCYRDFHDEYSYNYLKNRLSMLSREGYLVKNEKRSAIRFYYPNISFMKMAVSGEVSYGKTTSLTNEVEAIVNQLNINTVKLKGLSVLIGIHDIILSFYGLGIYKILDEGLRKLGWRYEESNKEYIAPDIELKKDRFIGAIFEPTGRVRVIVKCTNNPIEVSREGLEELRGTLSAFRTHLRLVLEILARSIIDPVTIPPPESWIVKHLHFNIDIYHETEINWHINLKPTCYDRLFLQIYNKRGKPQVKRVEIQMSPDVVFAELIKVLKRFFCNC